MNDEIEAEKARIIFVKEHGREPTYYELYGHPNWKKQLREWLEERNKNEKQG
jgi:hypothetical protein